MNSRSRAIKLDPTDWLRKKVEKLEVEKSQFETLAAEIEAIKRNIK